MTRVPCFARCSAQTRSLTPALIGSVILLLASCVNVPTAKMSATRHAEDRLGTGSEFLDFQYHVLSEDRHASALKFDGYLFGFEKAKRERIGFDSPWLSCSFFNTYQGSKAIFAESGLEYKDALIADYPEWVNFACKRFDDRDRVFLSHAVKFEYEREPVPYISPTLLFSVYPSHHQGQRKVKDVLVCNDEPLIDQADRMRCSGDDKIYLAGWNYLAREFTKELTEKLQAGSYTHIVIASMGWNTSELETIQNYNSLMGHLFDAAKKDAYKVARGTVFRPLFIGLAWPSAWTFRTSSIATITRGLSVINKGYDADELGLTWYGALINGAVREAVAQSTPPHKPRPTVVVLGHSYGARALSHAVAACPFFDQLTVEQCRTTPSADIVIGLQGAFNRSRFLSPTEDGHYPQGTLDLYIYRDGSPLQRYDVLMGHGTRHFYLWSNYDGATTRMNLIGGGDDVCRFVGRHSNRFGFVPCAETVATVYRGERGSTEGAAGEAIAREACTIAAEYLDPVGPCATARVPRPLGADAFVTDPAQVLLIDASGLVHFDTPLHGGGAHSDIYKWQVGKVIWQIVRDNSRSQ